MRYPHKKSLVDIENTRAVMEERCLESCVVQVVRCHTLNNGVIVRTLHAKGLGLYGDGRPGGGVTKKSPFANFKVSFIYNFKSIQVIIMKFGTRFRS